MSGARLEIAVVMEGVEDYGGLHGQATSIAIEVARLGHRVCYLSRWPVSRGSERVAELLEADIEVLTPRWVGGRSIRLRPTPDDSARLRRLLGAARRQRVLPSRRLLRSASAREEAGEDFARIAAQLLRGWRERLPSDRSLLIHVISRASTNYLERLRSFDAPIVFSEVGQLALFQLETTTAPRLQVNAYTADSPDGARVLEDLEARPVAFIPCMGGFGSAVQTPAEFARTFALVNRLVPAKRTEVAIRAASIAGVELEVFGSGPEEGELRRLIGELGLEKQVRLRGLAKRSEIQHALDSADAFVLCSLPLIDGTPVAVLEAMSRARPVVAYPFPGLQALVRDGVEGLYFDGSPTSLAAVLRRLATESGLGAALGRAGRERWEREFAPSVLAAQYEAVYETAISRARERAL